MSMAKIQIIHGQNGERKIWTMRFDHKMSILTMPIEKFLGVSGQDQVFRPLTMGGIPDFHDQCLTPGPTPT